MAINNNCFFQVEFPANGLSGATTYNLSTYVRDFTLNTGREELDPTSHGAGTRLVAAGLETWSMDITLNMSFSTDRVPAAISTGVDIEQLLWDIFKSNSAEVTVTYRPNRSAIGADNPEYTGNGVMSTATPVSGSVGDWLTSPFTIMASSELGRATA